VPSAPADCTAPPWQVKSGLCEAPAPTQPGPFEP
jgi:hypothetical protein